MQMRKTFSSRAAQAGLAAALIAGAATFLIGQGASPVSAAPSNACAGPSVPPPPPTTTTSTTAPTTTTSTTEPTTTTTAAVVNIQSVSAQADETTTTTAESTTTTTLPPPAHVPVLVTGALAGGGPHVKVIKADDASVLRSFFAYDPNFHGGVNVALGDVDNDGYQDIITAPGAGGGPHVRVLSGKTGLVIKEFMAYDPSFTGGVSVAACDVDDDGNADIITGAGAGGGPHVKVFDGGATNNATLASFFAYDPNFHGGVNVGSADVSGDGKADVITGPGAGGGPHVRIWNIAGATPTEFHGFMAYAANFTGGVFVGANVGADQVARLIVGAGPGGGQHVRIFGAFGAELAGIIPAGSGAQGGTVAIGQLDGDSADEYAIGNASGSSAVRAYNLPTTNIGSFEAYPGFGGGVSIAVGVI